MDCSWPLNAALGALPRLPKGYPVLDGLSCQPCISDSGEALTDATEGLLGSADYLRMIPIGSGSPSHQSAISSCFDFPAFFSTAATKLSPYRSRQ